VAKDKWNAWFIGLAKYVATASKDPSTKVGAVIIDEERRIVSCGYNGLPRGVEDNFDRLTNRDVKYKMIVHAERNALLFARGPVKNCTLYTYPMMPCGPCASMVIQAGIKKVVAPLSDNPRWQEDMKLSMEMFAEAGVEVVLLKPEELPPA
jgi:dCMP deaminase